MNGFSPWLSGVTPNLVIIVGAICTLALYSILYKENKIYRLFEHIFLGLGTGYMVATYWNDTLLPKWWEPFWEKGHWGLIFAVIAGLLYYFIYSQKLNYLARLIIGFMLGIAAGRSFQEFTNDYWPQIPKSFKPLIPHGEILDAAGQKVAGAVTTADALNNLIFMVILICVMSYFFFSFEQKHPVLKNSAKWGRWLMMFTFGAIFGSTIMGRLALLIDRMDFLLNDFGPIIGGPVVTFGLLLGMAGLILYLVTRPGASQERMDAE